MADFGQRRNYVNETDEILTLVRDIAFSRVKPGVKNKSAIPVGALRAGTTPRLRFVSPGGSGRQDGTDYDNSYSINQAVLLNYQNDDIVFFVTGQYAVGAPWVINGAGASFSFYGEPGPHNIQLTQEIELQQIFQMGGTCGPNITVNIPIVIDNVNTFLMSGLTINTTHVSGVVITDNTGVTQNNFISVETCWIYGQIEITKTIAFSADNSVLSGYLGVAVPVVNVNANVAFVVAQIILTNNIITSVVAGAMYAVDIQLLSPIPGTIVNLENNWCYNNTGVVGVLWCRPASNVAIFNFTRNRVMGFGTASVNISGLVFTEFQMWDNEVDFSIVGPFSTGGVTSSVTIVPEYWLKGKGTASAIIVLNNMVAATNVTINVEYPAGISGGSIISSRNFIGVQTIDYTIDGIKFDRNAGINTWPFIRITYNVGNALIDTYLVVD